MLETSVLSMASSALDYSSTREEVLSNNIANINTPGYQRKDVSFDDVLATAEGGMAKRVSDIKNMATRMFGGDQMSSGSTAEVITPEGGPMRVDGNNVDMDVEMAAVAKNQIYYQTVTQIVSTQFSDLKSVIKG